MNCRIRDPKNAVIFSKVLSVKYYPEQTAFYYENKRKEDIIRTIHLIPLTVFEFWKDLYMEKELKYEIMPITCQIFTVTFLKKCFPPISINHKETEAVNVQFRK